MRGLSRKYAIWPWDEILLHERLGSLQRGMEQFQLTLDRVERRLDEQVEVFDTLRADLEHLEDKVNAVRSANNTMRPHHVAQSMKHDNVTSSSRPTRVQPER